MHTSLTQTYHRHGGLGTAAGRFFLIFLEENSCFNAILITFRTFLEPFEITKFLTFESQVKKSNW